MPRSKASRQRDCDRVSAWRKANPERAKANTRKAWKNYAPKAAENRARKRARSRTKNLFEELGVNLSPVTKRHLQLPEYIWIDAHGLLHREKWETADHLERRLHEEQKAARKKTRGAPRSGHARVRAGQEAGPRENTDHPPKPANPPGSAPRTIERRTP